MPNLRRFGIFLMLILTLCPLGNRSAAAAQAQSEPVKLKVLVLPFLTWAPLQIAQEEGFFAEQGLQVEFVKMAHSQAAIPAVIQGDLDVLAGALQISHFNAIARGGLLRLVADKGHLGPTDCPYKVFIARRPLVESGQLTTPAQLQGKRLSLSYGQATEAGYALESLIKFAGLRLDQVEIKQVPDPVQAEAMGQGTIDLAVGGEPWATRMVESGNGVKWLPEHEILPDFQFDAVYYGPNLLRKNPDAGRRFMVAYLKGVEQFLQGKTPRNLEILAKHTGLPTDLLKKACWPLIRKDGIINVKSVMAFQTWAKEKGYLAEVVPEKQFWDPSFVEYAARVLAGRKQGKSP